jgi:hypothetical protein
VSSRRVRLAIPLVVAATLASACSSSKSAAPSAAPTSKASSPKPAASTPPARPAGPAAVLTGPVTGGKGINLLSASTLIPAPSLTRNEYFASGTATAYVSKGEPDSGRWNLAPSTTTAAYKTRIIVRVPKDPKRFNGTVVVEWLNVSAGSDSDPDFSYMAAELEREGAAYVGVSAQQVGIDGSKAGDIASQLVPGLGPSGLRKADPARYGTLHHPGDAYSYDIFTQVTRALRTPGKLDVLGGLHPQRIIAAGESQSASRMVTYVNGVQPLTREFDGFFVHSRGGGAAPLTGSGDSDSFVGGKSQIRTDSTAPVLIFETETDIALLRYDQAEQPDSAQVHVWETAGTSHADAFVVGPALGLLGCGTSGTVSINSGPQVYLVRAAISALDHWVRTGQAPASAPRLEHSAGTLKRASDGIALGGVRTPPVDVPVSVQSGQPADASKVICALFGSNKPFTSAMLTQLYTTKIGFVAKWNADLDQTISAGHVLPADRASLVAQAEKVAF